MLSKLKPIDMTLAVMVAVLAFALVDANFINLAHAAADPFAKTTTKGNELIGFLTGSIAVMVTTLVIVVIGFLMLMSRISHLLGVKLIIGAGLIGAAGGIAEWIYR